MRPQACKFTGATERFFAEITNKSIRRGAFKSVPELEKTIMDYLATNNVNPMPFASTAKADAILANAARVRNKR